MSERSTLSLILRSRARAHVEDAYLKGSLQGMKGAELRKYIDAAYPFGEKKNAPYKAWLNIRREFVWTHGLFTDAERRRQQRAIDKSPLIQACKELNA